MHRFLALGLLAILGLTLACGATRQPRGTPEPKGFLADYTVLEENPEEGSKLRFIRADVDWSGYDKLMLDPVQFWRSSDVEAGLTGEQAQGLVNYFHATFHKEFAKYFEIVDSPQAGTLRISAAFTRLGERNVTLDTVSTYVPQLRLLGELTGAFTGRPPFVGDATFEAKVTDAQSGLLVAAALDTRVGGKTIKSFDDWADVKAAIDFWARNSAHRVCKLREEATCPKP
ncbi:MAG: DUF3313 domain-containing protein [Myxococcota bacterium]|nr:DUF3313 domain-containing protein [Myxococcota bacterium]